MKITKATIAPTPDKLLKKIRRQTGFKSEIPCQHCGKPMYRKKGKITRKMNPKTKRMIIVRAPDQDVKFHKECRKAGKRAARSIK